VNAGPTERVLTVIGLWSDRAEPYWPDPKDFVDAGWSAEERANVVKALRSGIEVKQFRGESTCRVCGRLNGSRELSDGRYLWPDGLAHYVGEHGVRLPEAVEAHFLQQPASEGALSTANIEPDDLLDADESWWLSLGSASWD
jgi:hypothetical protein